MKCGAVWIPSIWPRTWSSSSSPRATNSENLTLEEPALRTAIALAILRFRRPKGHRRLNGVDRPRRSALEPVLPEPAVQLRARDAELFGGPHLVAASFAHGLSNGLSLEDAEIGAAQQGGIFSDRQREVLGVDEPPVAHDRRFLEHVSQLADIATTR